MVPVFWVRKLEASEFRVYPSSSATFSIFRTTLLDMRCVAPELRAREAVETWTPALLATSTIVARGRLLPGCFGFSLMRMPAF